MTILCRPLDASKGFTGLKSDRGGSLMERRKLQTAAGTTLSDTMASRKSAKAFGTILVSIVIGGLVAASLTIRGKPGASAGAVPPSETTAIPPPVCGRPNDGQVHIPPDWTSFSPPATGESYVDPVFGCKVRRLTNSSVEETLPDGKRLSFMHYYSTFSPINATDTMVLIYSSNGAWRIKGIDGNVVIAAGKMPTMNNGHPVWDAPDGNVFYYALGKTLHKATIAGGSVKSTVVQTFKEYGGIVSPDAADLSQDGGHIALVGQNANNTMDVFVWSLHAQAKTSVYRTVCTISGSVTTTPQPGCLHKLQLTANNLLSIQFAEDGPGLEQGTRLWDGTNLVHLQDTTNHYDTGYDLSGKPIFIAVNNSKTLAPLKNPCRGGWGLDVRQQENISSAVCLLDKQPSWHVSYRGSASQPWAAISFFDDRKPGPELFDTNPAFQAPSLKNWELFEGEIILARIDGGAIYRLAHARSRSAEGYWGTPRAAISRDGEYVVFTSNMAHPDGCPQNMHVPDECTDVYLIKAH